MQALDVFAMSITLWRSVVNIRDMAQSFILRLLMSCAKQGVISVSLFQMIANMLHDQQQLVSTMCWLRNQGDPSPCRKGKPVVETG